MMDEKKGAEMEFKQLKTFRVVAENLNFTRASEQLNMAQSSVSAQISNLEEELGVKLFDRIGRKVFLTDAGGKLYAYARRIEGITDEVRSALAEDSYIRGNLTIRIPETLATFYMPDIIARYRQEFPGVKLNCINCSDHELPRELNTGRIDLAFLMSDNVALKDVNVHYLKSEKLTVLAAPDHRLASGQPCTLSDLNNETILLPMTD